MVSPDLTEAEPGSLTEDETEELNEAEAEVAPVSYSSTDFDVEGLVNRHERGDIVIPSFGHGHEDIEVAAFQRSFVWRKSQMDRFIESLLLGFPIPGIMLVQQRDKRYLVLDGQQRIRTLTAFRDGIYDNRVFALENVAKEFLGLTYKTLTVEQARQLNDTFIQATIVRTDGSPSSLDSVYQVFERLNSGGTQLTPHEIRVALYPGPFVDLLGTLNNDPNWRALYGTRSPRIRDHEVILRIFAFFLDRDDYLRPLKRFLNQFLGKYRELQDLPTGIEGYSPTVRKRLI